MQPIVAKSQEIITPLTVGRLKGALPLKCKSKIKGLKAINRNREIGLQIKSFREKRHLSQAALGEAIGVSYQQVQKYESGITPVTVERLEQIAKILGIQPTDILSESAEVREEMEDYRYLKTRFPGILSQDEAKLLKLFRSVVNERLKRGILSQVKTVVAVEKELKRKGRS